jgi:hypothetical protein
MSTEKSELKVLEWIWKTFKQIWKEVFFWMVIPTALMIAAMVFGILTVGTKDVILPPLIEAEATIFGFFGIIIVYILKSLDEQYDRCDKQFYDMSDKGKDKEVPEMTEAALKAGLITERVTKGEMLWDELVYINKRKISTIAYASKIGAMLVMSIFISILSLGIGDFIVSGMLIIFAVFLFLASTTSIFVMFRDEAKEIKKLTTSYETFRKLA